MTSKDTKMMLTAFGLFVVLVFTLIFAGLGQVRIRISTGAYLSAYHSSGDGSHLVVIDGEPFVMSKEKEDARFQGLEDGDRLMVFHSYSENSDLVACFPGHMDVNAHFQLPGKEEIPNDTLDRLRDLGWNTSE